MASENDFPQLRFSGDREKVDCLKLFDSESPEDMKSTVSVHKESDRKRPRPELNYNVRKSLAWDSAFLTSPGVLELEELFGTVSSRFLDSSVDLFGHEDEILLPSDSLEPIVKSRVDKCDLRKSLAWDNAFFTNAGVLDPEELSIVNRGFKNPGTQLPGIQEDVSRSNESNFSVDSGSSSLTSLEIDLFEDIRELSHKSTNKLSASVPSLKFQSVTGSNKLVPSSRTMVKGVATSQRQNINPHGAERSRKKASSSAPSLKQISAGNGKLSSPSLKPPKTSDRIKKTPTSLAKRASLGASLAKMGTAKSASGQCLTIPKKHSPGNLDSTSYCSTPLPQSSSLGFPTAAHESVSCSLSNSGSAFKTPLRCTIRKKAELGSSRRSSYVLSTPTSSSCTSPDSSLDGWLSVSSSTSAIEEPNNPKAYLNSIPRQVSLERTASRELALHQSCTANASRGRRVLNHHHEKTPLGTGSLPSTVSRNTKPSGLRVPSPKIGYFDEGNSSTTKTDGSTQLHSGTQSAKTKVGSGISNLNRAANRAKNEKPISRTISRTPKQNGPETTLQITAKNPTEVEAEQNASLSDPATRATIKICFPMAFKVEKDMPQKTFRDCLETETLDIKVQDASIEGIRSSSKAAESECDEGSTENKIGTKQQEIIFLRSNKRTPKEHEEQMHCTGKNRSLLDDSNKENVNSFKEQVDGLSKYLGTIDLGGDVVIELKVNKTPSDAQSAVLTLKL